MGIWDRSGTVSITSGTAIVTGTLTTWLASARPGDRFSANAGAKWYEILSVDSNTQITLATNFAETTVSGGPYAIDPSSYRHQVPSDILEQVRLVIASQTDLFETAGAPSASLGADKSLAFDPAARVYYYKVDGVWGGAVSLGGADGVDAGFKVSFSTTTGMADPGIGAIRFNNATRASVTAIAIDDLSADIGNPDVSNYILAWDDSTSTIRGTLILRKIGATGNFAIFSITGASVDNSGWTQLTVTHVLSGGTFAAADQLSAVFVRNGDKGTAGVDGVSAGPKFTLSTNTSMEDPGAGTLRFNNATLPSATSVAIDALSAAAGNPSLASFINTWDDSSNTAHRGTLTFTKLGAMENFAIFAITGAVTDNTGWHQLTITYVNGAGTLANGDSLIVQFDRTGNKGADGLSAGFPYAFSTTLTMADPGTGGVRFNNATFSAVTAIAIDDLSADTGNPSVAAAIATWDDSTSPLTRGVLTIRKLTAPQNFQQYAINSDNVVNAGWTQLSVAHVAGAGSFADTDLVTVEFARTGDKGLDGLGSGDVIAANNLNDLADKQAAADNLSIHGPDIASAATINLNASDGFLVDVTGTSTIATVQLAEGRRRMVRFTGTLTLTHGASLVLPGAANITTGAGDIAEFIGYAAGVVRCLFHPATYNPKKTVTAGAAQTLTADEQSQARANVYAAPFEALAQHDLIINGGQRISQENITNSVTLTATGTLQNKYLTDQFAALYRGTFVAAGQQVTDAPPGYENSLKFTVSTAQVSMGASDELSIVTPVRGDRTSRLSYGTANARRSVLGFWVKANRTGTYSGSVRSTVTGGGSPRCYPFTFAVGVANTWEYKTVSFTGDTTGTWGSGTNAGAFVVIAIAAGTSRVGAASAWAANDYSGVTATTNGVAATTDVFQLTGVSWLPVYSVTDLPTSANAWALQRAKLDEERYCMANWCKSMRRSIAPANGLSYALDGFLAAGSAVGAVAGYSPPIFFPTAMDVAPSVAFYRTSLGATNGVWERFTNAWASSTATVTISTSETMFSAQLTSTFTANSGIGIAGGWTASARMAV